MNIKVRLKNPTFWITFIPAIALLVTQVAALFGYSIDLQGVSDDAIEIVKTVFVLLGVLGVAVDPTTKGVGDSVRALTYDEPN